MIGSISLPLPACEAAADPRRVNRGAVLLDELRNTLQTLGDRFVPDGRYACLGTHAFLADQIRDPQTLSHLHHQDLAQLERVCTALGVPRRNAASGSFHRFEIAARKAIVTGDRLACATASSQ